jgi:dTMP kinase
MQTWLERLRGRFLVFDGPDGSGKSTQLSRFARICREAGLVVCEVREPGGTSIGEQIRSVLLDPANTDMSLRCELMLYMASRAQLIDQTIRPALQAGSLVLADRFISSTLAYQGTAGGIGAREILQVGEVAIGSRWPDLVVIFDVDERTAASRLNPLLDRMERKGEAFHRRVRQGFLQQAGSDPEHHLVIDSSVDEESVFRTLCEGVEVWMLERGPTDRARR